MTTDRLAALLDPENAPARHGEWSGGGWVGQVQLTDKDGCTLFVDALDVAALVNDAVDRAAGVTVAPQPAPDLRAAAQAVVEDAESITYIGVCEVKTPLIMALREALNGD